MTRYYKKLSTCKMCKNRYVIKKKHSRKYIREYYCPQCYNKYIKEVKENK